jgi:hypothetical protein
MKAAQLTFEFTNASSSGWNFIKYMTQLLTHLYPRVNPLTFGRVEDLVSAISDDTGHWLAPVWVWVWEEGCVCGNTLPFGHATCW